MSGDGCSCSGWGSIARWVRVVVVLLAVVLGGRASAGIGVAHVVPELGRAAECLSARFLRTLARETGWTVRESLDRVGVFDAVLDAHAVAILSQSGGFELSEHEALRLRDWIESGGLLVLSGPCGSGDWLVSAERALERLYPERVAETVPDSHPLFSALFDLGGLVRTDGRPAELRAIERDGRIAVLLAPDGVNDTDGAGGGCCCCGGNELRDAHLLLANLLVYALLG